MLTRSRPLARSQGDLCSDVAEHIPFAGGLLRSRSVGLAAFAFANPFRNFPSCSNPKRLKCSSLPLFLICVGMIFARSLKRISKLVEHEMNNELADIAGIPPQYSAEALKGFREQFAADLKQNQAKERRYAGPIMVIFLVGFALIIGACVAFQQLVKWMACTGIFLLFAGASAVGVAASSLQKQLLCAACHNIFQDDIDSYCPACGSASLEPEDWVIGGRQCNTCGKNLHRGKNRNFRYRFCTHCGVFLCEKGL
jgi:hypothetical protein